MNEGICWTRHRFFDSVPFADRLRKRRFPCTKLTRQCDDKRWRARTSELATPFFQLVFAEDDPASIGQRRHYMTVCLHYRRA